jgi:hypothetical protein
MGSRGPAPQPWRTFSRHGTRRGHRTNIYVPGTFCLVCRRVSEGDVRCPKGSNHAVRTFDLNDPAEVERIIDLARGD